MSGVRCEQFRYTWAERRLDGRGAGFGIVLRSPAWPDALLADPAVRLLLTDLSPSARRESGASAAVRLSHLRVAGGSLLVAKRAVGTDGAGRPGNYCVHALFDPSATLGALDLEALVDSSLFVLERAVDAEPDDQAALVEVPAAASWSPAGAPLRDELRGRLAGLCGRLPADLVNQLGVEAAPEAGDGVRVQPAGELDRLVARFAQAVEVGAARQDLWWERRGWSVEEWQAELEPFVIMNLPLRQLPDPQLWARWDRARGRGRTLAAEEVLTRSALLGDPDAVAEVARRPRLLDDLADAGVRAGGRPATTAAHWVAAAGSDAQALELARGLLGTDQETSLPAPLLARLQQRSPDELGAALVPAVAQGLDGTQPMSPEWRAVCLRRFAGGEASCADIESLVAAAADAELADAVRAAVRSRAQAVEVWRRLGAVLPFGRCARAFAGGSKSAADFLLTQGLPGASRPSLPALTEVWPRLGATLGWAEPVRTLLPRLAARDAALRRQRLLLLVAVVVLLLAAVALVVLLVLRTP